MRERKLHYAIRCSIENFGKFDYVDKEGNNDVRYVRICPIYAISQIEAIKSGIVKRAAALSGFSVEGAPSQMAPSTFRGRIVEGAMS